MIIIIIIISSSTTTTTTIIIIIVIIIIQPPPLFKGGGPTTAYQQVVAIFYPFSQFCEIGSSLLSLQKQPDTSPNLFQRGVEYGKYATSICVR